ncbi:hypothetical protein BDZ89DRAFT_1116090 [Hymenopellis radicata]|nr:hypothetical protein BDZ89DRAFT_1116090 [Hymenopellis radicata]
MSLSQDPPAGFDLKAQLVAYLIGLATSNPTTGAIAAVVFYVVSAITLLIVPLIWPGSILSQTRRTINDTRDWLEDHARRRANGPVYRICASGHFALDDLSRASHACMREAEALRIALKNENLGLSYRCMNPPLGSHLKASSSMQDPISRHHIGAISVHENGYTVSIYCLLENHYGHHATQWVDSRFGNSFSERWRNRMSTVPELHASAATRVAEEVLKPESLYPSAGEIEGLVKDIFLDIDDELHADKWEAKAKAEDETLSTPPEVSAALSGSSLLAVIWDSTTHLAHIANTGNAGAIFARRRTSGTGTSCEYDVEVLAPLPRPDDILRMWLTYLGGCGGTVPLRVFGMAPWKWTNEIRKMVGWTGDSHFATNVQTPPYLTAEPVTASVRAEEGDVLIVASSNIFPSSLSPKERFDLVNKCLTDPTPPVTKQAKKKQKKTGHWAPPDHWYCSSQGVFNKLASHEYGTQNEDGLYEERNVARRVMESLGWTGMGN